MHALYSLLLLLLCHFAALAQEDDAAAPTAAPTTKPWGGCINPDNPDASTQVRIGEPTAICLTIGPGGDWAAGVPYIRFIFTPKADQYSRFHIPNSYNDLVNGDTDLQGRNLTVHTASQQILSFLRVYFDPDTKRVYPFLTAIIDVRDGNVAGIAWDNACVFCNADRCIENTYDFAGNLASDLEGQSAGCYIDQPECEALQQTGGGDCDIQLYVVWTGTDVNGDAFQSSANRFSAFPPGRLQDRVKSAFAGIKDYIPDDIPGVGR